MADILSLYINPNGGSGGGGQQLITVEAKIGGATIVTPDGATLVAGLADASDTLQSPEFADAQVEVFIGNIPIPGYDQGDGGLYFTKALSSDTITLSQPLTTDDDIKIKIFGPIGTNGGGGGDSLRFGVAGEDFTGTQDRDFDAVDGTAYFSIYNHNFYGLETFQSPTQPSAHFFLSDITGGAGLDTAVGYGITLNSVDPVNSRSAALTALSDGVVIYSGDSGRNDGFGLNQLRIITGASEAGMAWKNTGGEGKSFDILSTSDASGLSSGKFVIGSIDDGIDLMHFAQNGIGLGQFDGDYVDAAVHIRSYSFYDSLLKADEMNNNLRFKMGIDDSISVSDRETESMKSYFLHLRNEMDTDNDGGFDRDVEFWLNGIVGTRLPRRPNSIFNGTITLNQVNTTDVSGDGIANAWNNHAMYYIQYRCDAIGNVDTLDVQFMQGNDVFLFDNDGEVHIYCDDLEETRHIKCTGTAVLNMVGY